MTGSWPWPLDPHEVNRRYAEISQLADAALREVSTEMQETRPGVTVSVTRDGTADLIKAVTLAFLSLGIDFIEVDEEDYLERYKAHVGTGGNSGGLALRKGWRRQLREIRAAYKASVAS